METPIAQDLVNFLHLPNLKPEQVKAALYLLALKGKDMNSDKKFLYKPILKELIDEDQKHRKSNINKPS